MTKKQHDEGLGTLDGMPVRSTGVAITNAGDGLSQAMKTDPMLLHSTDKVYVVLECEVGKITFEPIKDGDGYKRVHTLRAGTATLIDADSVGSAIDAQREKNLRAIEAERGVQRLPIELEDEHRRNEHEFISAVEGCSLCDEAKAAT